MYEPPASHSNQNDIDASVRASPNPKLHEVGTLTCYMQRKIMVKLMDMGR